ncbi:MAG: hypothetical protein BroJett018_54470 [Chloroflexota bacterium]|nr:MAG: hypothetical protein BroJett018_54470 [Chloroflexota bacterium]
MPRGLLFRRIIAGIVILLFVAAAIYNAVDEFDTPIPLMIAAILGIAVLIEPASIIWDRYGGGLSVHRRKPAADAVRDADAYLEGRLRQFDSESKLFVELAGDTLIQTSFSSEAHQFEDIQQAVELHKGRFVLIGEPGAGKSTTLRQLMIQAIRDYRQKTNPRLPVWINLGLSGTPINADDLLQFWWDEQAYLPGTPDELIQNDAVWFFMDGLNEMPLDSRAERAQALKAFLDKHPTLPVIVTCRMRDYEEDETLNLGLPIVRVHELDEGRIQEFITKRGASADLWEKIHSNDALRRMADNPYKLVMLMAVYQARRELPERLDELYGQYVTEAYKKYSQPDYRENRDYPLVKTSWPNLERKLKRLAFLMIKDGKGTAASVAWARRKIGKRALMDGINLGVLLVDGEDVKFYHQSLHGFFAVDDINRLLAVKDFYGWRPRFESLPILMNMFILEIKKRWFSTLYRMKSSNRKSFKRHIGDFSEFDPLITDLLITWLREIASESGTSIQFNPVPLLESIGTPAVDPLINALQDSDVQWWAASALGRIGTPAVDPLILALQDADSGVRRAVAEALGEIGNPRAVDPLILALQDADSGVRRAAADALGQIGDPRAVDPLIKSLRDSHSGVRRAAAQALGKIGDPAVAPLIIALQDTDSGVRQVTAQALGKIGDPRAVHPLITALHDSGLSVRQEVVDALGRIGTPAIDPLIKALGDANSGVRRGAVDALGKIADPRAVESLIIALYDSDLFVRRGAVDVLRKIGTPDALATVEQWERRRKSGG